jgi:predicted dehydrogenase
VLSVPGSYTQDWLLLPTDYNWRVEPDGGTNLRAVADIGTHWMDLSQFVADARIEAVCADLATYHAERLRPTGQSETFGSAVGEASSERVHVSSEDYAAVLLRLGGGARGVFHVCQMSAGRKNRLVLEISGTEGSMAWDSESPNDLWLGRRGRSNELLHRDHSLLHEEAERLCHYPGGHSEGFPDTFKQLFLAFYTWIETGMTPPSPVPTFTDGDHEVRLCEAIAASTRQKAWVAVA